MPKENHTTSAAAVAAVSGEAVADGDFCSQPEYDFGGFDPMKIAKALLLLCVFTVACAVGSKTFHRAIEYNDQAKWNDYIECAYDTHEHENCFWRTHVLGVVSSMGDKAYRECLVLGLGSTCWSHKR